VGHVGIDFLGSIRRAEDVAVRCVERVGVGVAKRRVVALTVAHVVDAEDERAPVDDEAEPDGDRNAAHHREYAMSMSARGPPPRYPCEVHVRALPLRALDDAPLTSFANVSAVSASDIGPGLIGIRTISSSFCP